MVRKVEKSEFSQADQNHIAEFVMAEFEARKKEPRREFLEKHVWPEIDRMVRMESKANRPRDPNDRSRSWMSAIEMPSQADALEVLSADVLRLVMPVGNDWYFPTGQLTDAWGQRIQSLPFITGTDVVGVNDDQDTADLLVRTNHDHWHRQYPHRGHWNAVIVDALKYGTYAARAVLVRRDVVTDEVRDVKRSRQLIPVILPSSIKHTYLDPSLQRLMHEGMMIAPNVITDYSQKLDDLQLAAVKGNGYLAENIKKLEGFTVKGGILKHLKLVRMEGDIIVPKERGESMLLSNWIVTVCKVGPTVVRMVKNNVPFRSYLSGIYEPDDGESIYGASPLTRGRPLQEALSEIWNRAISTSILDAEPPIEYSDDDTVLKRQGGPMIAPGESFPVSEPGSIRPVKIGDPTALFAIAQGIDAKHEQITKVNDPRRGAETKSHTTGFAKDVELSRSLLPTEDFVAGLSENVRSWLYMEYELSKMALGNPVTMFVNSRGIRGHIEMTRKHLPDGADYVVEGARGAFTKRERRDNVVAFITQLLAIEAAEAQAVQLGLPSAHYREMKLRLAEEFGVEDADKLVGSGQAPAGGPQQPSGVGGPSQDSPRLVG